MARGALSGEEKDPLDTREPAARLLAYCTREGEGGERRRESLMKMDTRKISETLE